ALPLAARKVPRPLPEHVRKPEDLGRRLHPAPDLGLLEASHLQPERHVVVGVHVRVERVVLEDHRHVAGLRRQVVDHLAADPPRPGGDVLETRDHPQRGRLAAPRRADEDDELAVTDVQVEVAHRPRAVRVDLRQLLELDARHGPGRLTPQGNVAMVLHSAPSMAAVAVGASRRRRLRYVTERRGVLATLLISPAVIFIGALVGAPLVLAVYLSFTDATAGSLSGPWVGLDNFRHELNDPIFVDAIWHTFLFTVISQAVVVLCAG